MKLLIDMNLAPAWVETLTQAGHQADHWSKIGAHNASDREIMHYAVQHDYTVLTHDLDFGALLNLTKTSKPSVIQMRIQDVTPQASASILLAALQQFQSELESGALLIVETEKNRVRLLPLRH